MEWPASVENPVLHVVVVGFHHKKGCQVEYSYPPLIDGNTVDSNECPEEWKHLPSLALPDGAHNFTEDTVYFHLPSRSNPKTTIFGVSCYRQMSSMELLNRGTDVTRNTVQKSVCVLSRLPVFGLIQAKLQLITHAYFKGRDFSQVALLEETYKTLNLSLTDSLLQGSQVFLGLSCREMLQQFQHRILILFKLMLLERRVLFYSSPVKPICTSLLTVISLFPGMIEHGLIEAANYSKRQSSSMLQVVECDDDYLRVQYPNEDCSSASLMTQKSTAKTVASVNNGSSEANANYLSDNDMTEPVSQSKFYVSIFEETCPSGDELRKIETAKLHHNESKVVKKEQHGIFGSCPRKPIRASNDQDKSVYSTKYPDESFPVSECSLEDLLDKDDELTWETDKLLLEISEALDDENCLSPSSLSTELLTPMNDAAELQIQSAGSNIGCSVTFDTSTVMTESEKENKLLGLESQNNNTLGQKLENSESVSTENTTVPVDQFGFPLSIFTKGMLCHPYLSLHLFDILNDINIRGFIIGATNALFRQKAHLTDVVIELSDLRIDIHDHELKKQLTLTTADLRFAEHLVRSIGDEKGDVYLDDTAWSEWEGGDDWLRSQFKSYLLSMLATVSQGDDRMVEDFNSSFVAAWKTTQNYKQWRSKSHPGMAQIAAEHLFHGQLSIADVRMRINQMLQQADRNKKINAVVSQTGKVVTQTGKAVGDALHSAKSAMTTWFGSISGSKT